MLSVLVVLFLNCSAIILKLRSLRCFSQNVKPPKYIFLFSQKHLIQTVPVLIFEEDFVLQNWKPGNCH